MNKVCLKCNHTRLKTDTSPDYECPNCGAIYSKVEARLKDIEKEINVPKKKRVSKKPDNANEINSHTIKDTLKTVSSTVSTTIKSAQEKRKTHREKTAIPKNQETNEKAKREKIKTQQQPKEQITNRNKSSDFPFSKVKANIGTLDILGHLLLWLVLIICTFGIAVFFFPYSFSKFIIDRTEIVSKQGVKKKLHCDTNVFGEFGHVILWIIITLLTFGLGYIFYIYKVWNYSLNRTSIIENR